MHVNGRVRWIVLAGLGVVSAAAADPWGTFQGDARHTGQATVVGPLLANPQWSFPVLGTPSSPAVAADGTIYLPTGMPPGDTTGRLYAITADGAEAQPSVELAGPPGSTAPAIGPTGTVYVHVNGTGVAGIETLHAFNADLSPKWTFEFNDGEPIAPSFVQSSPVVSADGARVFVGSQDGNLYALNAETGAFVWAKSPSVSSISSSPALSADGTTVYVHDHAGLFAYDTANGDLRWPFAINVPGGTGSPSVGADGTIYFAHVNNGTVYALNPNGTVKWSEIIGAQPVSTPALATDGSVYVGSNGLYAFTSGGQPKWPRFSDALFSSASPVIGANGIVYWRETTHLYAVNDDGTLAWELPIPYPALPGLDPSPAVGPDGALYVPVVDASDPLGKTLVALRTCPTDCEDGNPCTSDICTPAEGCVHPVAEDGTFCDDATVCNGRERCIEGACATVTEPLSCADADPCTQNVCDPAGGCEFPPAADGTACPDADACNGAETCQGGDCTPGTPPNCIDTNACTVDTCNPLSGCVHGPLPGCVPCQTAGDCADGNPCTSDTCNAGICGHSNLANGASCADGHACNGAETCQGGFCEPGAPLVCNDGNACTTDACDDGTGCTVVVLPNGTSCSDANACNGNEMCQAGACAAGTPLACGDGNPCTVDGCDAESGCTNASVANGTLCLDGNVCNGQETCQQGACTAGEALVCDDQNACTTDACSPASGCEFDARPNGSTCDDTTVCNGRETCVGGICIPGQTLPCDDGKPCTEDSCNDVSGCINAPQAGCTACDSPDDCDDGNPCTSDVCSSGSCVNAKRPTGASCSDNDVCNGVETCSAAGICQPGTALPCEDGNPCTESTCDPLTGCQTAVASAGVPCADGDLCNGDETCNGSGGCVAGSALACSDGNACTADACDPVAGCVRTNEPNGTACADATVCNGAETCQAGVCAGGAPLECGDDNPCTNDSCNAISGCINGQIAGCQTCAKDLDCNDHNPCTQDKCLESACANTAVADGVSCSDGSICNGLETCAGGTCTGGVAAACDDGNTCTTDFCDPVAGCQHSAVANGSSCADADACDGDERCQAGACAAGPALTCQDGNPCTEDSCDPDTGCHSVALPTGTFCNDVTVCNGAEICTAGLCGGGSALDCDDGNPCTVDSCDSEVGCAHVALTAGESCSDGDACNGLETCQAGACTAGAPPVCDDANPCTADACDPASGCVAPAVANGTSCDDATVCNGRETCQAGACTGGAALECSDGDDCTTDGCDAVAGCVHGDLAGIASVGCALGRALETPACQGAKLPRSVVVRYQRAQALYAAAAKATNARKAERSLRRASRLLKQGMKQVGRAGKSRLASECVKALKARLEDALTRVERFVAG